MQHAMTMDSSEEEDLQVALILGLVLRRRAVRRRKRRERRMWVRPILQRRRRQGAYHQLLQEMRLNDPERHFGYLRMSKETFDFLLQKVSPLLSHRRYFSKCRAAVSPAERLALTLRYLASGSSQASLSYAFRLGKSTVCSVVRETCDVLWVVLAEHYVKAPSSIFEWQQISQDFFLKWNFPNCIGAIDGKHIVIQAPKNSGSSYFNYKGTFSINLMAVCDAHYRFILIDVGQVGRFSDGGVFSNSAFGRAFEDGALMLPKPTPLPGTDGPELPYVMVGDEAFPLRNYLLRPYPGRNLPEDQAIFNYRLSRARRIIENSFGILAARWRLFRQPIIVHPKSVIAYTKAAVALHNFLRSTESAVYCPTGFVDGEDGEGNVIRGTWRDGAEAATGMTSVGMTSSNRYSKLASDTRGAFKDYFNSHVGQVSWQYQHVRRTS